MFWKGLSFGNCWNCSAKLTGKLLTLFLVEDFWKSLPGVPAWLVCEVLQGMGEDNHLCAFFVTQ